ncbi:hypothetical protein H0H93_003271 [Arthromyces matolae]|nr:hypothetical protein H0H93_003271 [Arthromyces matolae]
MSTWRKASQGWQAFNDHWRNAADVDTTTPYVQTLWDDDLEFPLDSSGFLDKTKGKIIVRDAYRTFLPRVRRLRHFTGAIMTGQPGTGKSCFIWHLLTELLRTEETVFFVLDHRTLFLHPDGVFELSEDCYYDLDPADKPKALPDFFRRDKLPYFCLCPKVTRVLPRAIFFSYSFIHIMAINPEHLPLYKDTSRRFTMWGMPVWTKPELQKALQIYNFELVSPTQAAISTEQALERLDNVIFFHGSAIEDVFMALFDPPLSRYNREWALTGLSLEDINTSHVVTPRKFRYSRRTRHVVTLIPLTRPPSQSPEEFDDALVPEFKSKVIARIVKTRFTPIMDYNEAMYLLYICHHCPESSELSNWAFQNWAYLFVRGDASFLDHPVVGLTTSSMVSMEEDESGWKTARFEPNSYDQSRWPPAMRKVALVNFSEPHLDLVYELFYIKTQDDDLDYPFDSFCMTFDEASGTTTLWMYCTTIEKTHSSSGDFKVVWNVISAVYEAMTKRQSTTSMPLNLPTFKWMDLKVKYVIVCPAKPKRQRTWKLDGTLDGKNIGWEDLPPGDVCCLFIESMCLFF